MRDRLCRPIVRLAGALLAALAIAGVAHAEPAEPGKRWMSGDELRREFSGVDTAGLYPTGKLWREYMHADGSTDYSEPGDDRRGRWWIDGAILCYSYIRPGTGGCFQVIRLSANCFDLFVRRERPGAGHPPLVTHEHNGKMWRNDLPSTCDEKPTV